MQKYIIILLFSLLSASLALRAQDRHRLSLPNREQLSSDKVLYVMQDSEGFLWYATDGGGVCRDDGRQVDVFRSDAEHPDLLGSNTVVCLAETGRRIVIGTTHGANVLDKKDYRISRLTEVDDKRVDDIIVTADGHLWLTANKKVYEYSPAGKLLRTLDAGDKYIFRLHETPQGQLLCTQWEGGTLRLDGGRFVQVGTEWPDSVDFSRVATDNQGRKLVSDGFGECHAVSKDKQRCWFDGTVLTKEAADSVRLARHHGTYMIELQETAPGSRWSRPERGKTAGLPVWIWWVLAVLLLVLSALVCHILMLHRQRRRFMQQIKNDVGRNAAAVRQSDAEQPSAPAQENEWLQRAIAQVEAHLNDEGYTVEQLSSDMCMSRMTFYRKIQSATGHTPTEFIRTLRLRRAAELLHEGRMNVTEISNATGFSSVSYFSRCFRTMFGVPPTQFCDSTSADR